MKLETNRRLFWFLKEGISLNPEKREDRDLYVQQVLSNGTANDVRQLLGTLPSEAFQASFKRVENFLPLEVRNFWEHYFASH